MDDDNKILNKLKKEEENTKVFKIRRAGSVSIDEKEMRLKRLSEDCLLVSLYGSLTVIESIDDKDDAILPCDPFSS